MCQLHKVTVILLIYLLLASPFLIGQPNASYFSDNPNASLTKVQWQEDLDFIIDKLKHKHLDPFFSVEEAKVDSLVEDIRKNIPQYKDEKIIAEFSKLIALFKWGHTRINLPVNYGHLGIYLGHKLDQEVAQSVRPFTALPIRIVQFEEGYYVQSTTQVHTELLGKKITHIAKTTIEEAAQRISAYIAYENESAQKLLTPIYLSITDLLLAEGIIPSTRQVSLTLEGGVKHTVNPLAYADESPWVDVLAHKDISRPLWLSKTDVGLWKVATKERFWTEIEQYYWYQYIPQNQALYIKINYIFEHPDLSLAAFMHQAMQAAENNNVERIIVDLRHNTGGAGDANRAIKLALQRWPKITEFGNLFFIVGRKTYSAAILLAQDLEKDANVVFIGEEIGGKLQHIGDAQRYILPNSKLTLRVSIKQHKDWTGLPDRSSIWLHYSIPFTFQDYSKGKDTALDFALNYSKPPLEEEIIKLYTSTNINVAILILYHLYTDPWVKGKPHATVALSLANYLYKNEEKLAYASAILNISLEYNYWHIPSLLLKAEIDMAMDKPEDALPLLQRVVDLDPSNQAAKDMLEAINAK